MVVKNLKVATMDSTPELVVIAPGIKNIAVIEYGIEVPVAKAPHISRSEGKSTYRLFGDFQDPVPPAIVVEVQSISFHIDFNTQRVQASYDISMGSQISAIGGKIDVKG